MQVVGQKCTLQVQSKQFWHWHKNNVHIVVCCPVVSKAFCDIFNFSIVITGHLQVTSALLFHFNRLEKSLEIACTKALVIASLNHLEKQGRPVLHWLGENLQQVAIFIVIHQDAQLLQTRHVFDHLGRTVLELLLDFVIVHLGSLQKLYSSLSQVDNGCGGDKLHWAIYAFHSIDLLLIMSFVRRAMCCTPPPP